MADPYAAATRPPEAEALALDSSLAAALAERGVGVLTYPEEVSARSGVDDRAVVLAEDGLVPPLARISPAFAVALLRAAGPPGEVAVPAGAPPASGSGERRPLYLVKTGYLAGPSGREGAVRVAETDTIAALEAARRGAVEWERDPDFGYEVPARVPGVATAAADAFLPRLIYAAADRVYEHAQLVELTKRRRHERLLAAGVQDPELHRAIGWPIEPTGQQWKD